MTDRITDRTTDPAILPIRVEEWDEGHRALVLAAVREAFRFDAFGFEARLFVVGSYAFGRSDEDPPGDLDLVVEAPWPALEAAGVVPEDYAFCRAPFAVRRAVIDALSPLAGGRHVDVFCAQAVRATCDEGRPVPRYDVEEGRLYGKAPGERFDGSYHADRDGTFRWIPEKPPRPSYPVTTAADLVRLRHASRNASRLP